MTEQELASDVPALLAEVQRLRTEIATLRLALAEESGFLVASEARANAAKGALGRYAAAVTKAEQMLKDVR